MHIEGNVTAKTRREEWRLGFPPHEADSGLRLSSQTRDHCASGQLAGLFGVALTSEASPGLVVRAMRDPTRGTLIAVERGGHKPVVITPESCTSSQVNVSRTSTVVNDVWAVKGSASADCPGLNAAVTFDGCHH